MKARVASHKPLSSHLARIKSKLQESKNTESEDNSEEEGKEAESSKHLDKMCLNNQVSPKHPCFTVGEIQFSKIINNKNCINISRPT